MRFQYMFHLCQHLDTLCRKSMASKIPQLQSKVNQASQAAKNHGASYYRLLLDQNKHYIQDPPTIEKCQSLAKQLFYTRLARFALLVLISSLSKILFTALYTKNN